MEKEIQSLKEEELNTVSGGISEIPEESGIPSQTESVPDANGSPAGLRPIFGNFVPGK